ncbi:MAG: glycosyltransferase family 9 protein [Chromatiales bacterium]|nr:glycosyltransferase family 9 protein [Chromatiales bacterium]
MPEQLLAGTAAARMAVLMVDRHLGNFLVATPVLRALGREGLARDRLFVIDGRFAELARRVPGFPPFITLARSGGSRRQELRALSATVSALRRFEPEITLDLQANNSGAWLARLSGATQRLAELTGRRRWAYTRRIALHQDTHRLQQYAAMAAVVDPEARASWPQLSPGSEDEAALEALWAQEGGPPLRPLACLHVGGGRPFKRWPAARFHALARDLHQRGLEPVFVGGPAESNLLAAEGRLDVPHRNLVGRTPLCTLLALLGQARLFIGNDSGPMHLAAAAGCPVVAIFGPNCARQWAPLAASRAIVHSGHLTLGRAEPPLGRAGAAIEEVSPALVLEAVDALLCPS